MVTVLALLVLGAAGWAHAGPLDPLDFTSLGAFPSAPGMYMLSTAGGTPFLSGPGRSFNGVVSNGVAVFDFDSIDVVTGQVINGTQNLPGALPVAFLSRTDITINGTIDASGGFRFGGPGGFAGGYSSPGAGGPGPGGGGGGEFNVINVPNPTYPPTTHYYLLGGGFGGPGNAAPPVYVPGGAAPGFAAGGSGGRAYANILSQLQGGSGGGSGVNFPGGGGGAIELGAVGKISVTGSILANGGSTFGFTPEGGGGGGGAGGGILLHGEGITLSGLLSAIGGNGGPGGEDGRSYPSSLSVWGTGGNGGGGQVVIDPGAGAFTNVGGTVAVGNGSFSVVPEPASLVLLGIDLLGVLGYARDATRRAAA